MVRKLVTLVCAVVMVGMVTLLPVGCSKNDSGTNAMPTVITVTGKVVGANGLPMASLPVVISTLPSVTTDANGNFTIPNVTAPYDVTVVHATAQIALVYIGLTRPDPTLTFITLYPSFPSSATLSGTVNGGDPFPQSLNHLMGVSFISPESDWTHIVNAPLTGAYSLSPVWNGPVTTTGTIHALQWQIDPTTFLPIAYRGYGTKAGVTLSNGGTFSAQNVTVTPIAVTNFSGTVTAQSGYTLSNRYVSTIFGSQGLEIINDATIPSTSSSTTFNYIIPNITGATLRLSALATKGAVTVVGFKNGLAVNANGATLTLPGGPEYSLPVSAATGVTTATIFSWTAMANGVYVVQFNGPVGKPKYQIVTSATTTTIPNLASLGLGLPPSASYAWTIRSVAPIGSVDAAASAIGLLGPLSRTGVTEGYIGDTGSARTFVTAP